MLGKTAPRTASLLALAPALAALSATGQGAGAGDGRALDDSVSLLSTGTLAGVGSSRGLEGEQAWDRVLAWVQANGGGGALGSLGTRETLHGGARVRGLVAREAIAGGGTVLLQVPRRLWIWLENFPEVRRVALAAEPSCEGVAVDKLKVAAALALELRKGERSFYFPWLSTLPTLDDFRAFHPRLASDAVAAEFSALPLMTEIREQQREDRAAQQCFEAWQRQPQSLVSGVTWDDVYGAIMNYYTRASRAQNNGDGTVSHAMVPLFDFINTGRSKTLNTAWMAVRKDSDFKVMLAKGVEAGGELLEPYCLACTNEDMLKNWGFYLEDNENRLPPDGSSPCGEPGSEELARLHRLVGSTLDVGGAQAAWASPRCLPLALAQEQGPLRCSLARLAWEQCAAPGAAAAPRPGV